ncbi:hypothetical protein AYO45_05035 [Gammaproteobacteria bacterium SCGC AG-212-F23]|nr:hypothetical protein AYO45_05035 [Gammaproteobacteria bacterium SCGC AG-212-F23]
MQSLNPPIGLLGGTFDPIHFGHLRTALEIRNALNLAEVYLVPCYQPVHRKLPIATPEQRLAMVSCAVADEPLLKVEDCEIRRQRPSYTIETIEEFRKNKPRTPLCLIMGIDALLSFSSWHRWQDILKQCHLVIAHRPQYQIPHEGVIADLLKKCLTTDVNVIHETLGGHIILHPVTPLEISATDIRKQIATGHTPRYLLPEPVLEYIRNHGVYHITGI